MSEVCPCCGKRYQDLGWHNNESSRQRIDAMVKVCRERGHKPDTDGPRYESNQELADLFPHRGLENIYGCHICRYVYRTDSSD